MVEQQPARILIVDDHLASLRLVQAQLERAGYAVLTASDGQAGLAAAAAESPDLILLDVMMPGLDGYEVCRRLKANEVTRIIPVVLLTALQDRADKLRGLEAGADEFLSKPADRAELLARVASLLRLKGVYEQQAQLIREQAARAAAEAAAAELAVRARQQAVVVEFGRRALSGLSLSTLLRQAAQVVAETLAVEYTEVLELLPGGRACLLRASVGWPHNWVGRGTVGTGPDSWAGVTLRTQEPVLVEDLRTETRFSKPKFLWEHGVVSGLSVLIHGNGQPFGILAAQAVQRRPFTQDDAHFLEAVANVITAAIERQRAEQALAHGALHDTVTDLPNRVLLQDRLQLALRITRRDQAPLAVLLMDLNRFREINETFGYQAGDAVLRQVGERLRRELGAADTLARLGGDAFALVLPSADREHALQTSARLRRALEEPFVVEGQGVEIGATIGMAIFPEHADEAETLLRYADIALQAAKRSTRGYAVYAPGLDRYTPGRLALVSELRQAIQRDQLLLHYQPKVSLESGRVVGVEALVRWQHPTRGPVPPDQFIPMAEQTGLIEPLSQWVLQAALQQAHAWRRMGLGLPVAVNLSMRNLHDRHLPDAIAALLTASRVPPTSLAVEITESGVMADPARAMETVTRLRALGVCVAIDDFGTGYSSLAYLKRLPVHTIKIDRSFVREMAIDETDRAIVRAAIDLSHSLGLSVVAEGVEDATTWQRLAELGCDEAQGYYLSRPLPAEDLERWLQNSLWRPGTAAGGKREAAP